jgi:hypothetical protein
VTAIEKSGSARLQAVMNAAPQAGMGGRPAWVAVGQRRRKGVSVSAGGKRSLPCPLLNLPF